MSILPERQPSQNSNYRRRETRAKFTANTRMPARKSVRSAGVRICEHITRVMQFHCHCNISDDRDHTAVKFSKKFSKCGHVCKIREFQRTRQNEFWNFQFDSVSLLISPMVENIKCKIKLNIRNFNNPTWVTVVIYITIQRLLYVQNILHNIFTKFTNFRLYSNCVNTSTIVSSPC